MKRDYDIHIYPKSRIATFDIGRMGMSKHHVVGLIEIDVTDARKKIALLKKKHENISFTSWLIKCVGDIVGRHPLIHGARKGPRGIAVFDDVDISIAVEREIGGEKVPVPYVVRGVNGKSVSDIHREILAAKEQPIRDEGDYVLGGGPRKLAMSLYYALPGFIRRSIWRIVLSRPALVKKMMGTVMITSVGMVGRVNGWIVPKSIHPLCFAISSVNKKPGVINGRVAVREYLPVTVLVDHDVIDGAPAVRVMGKLVDAIERGYLL